MSRRKFEPTEAQRRQVMTMSGFGIQQAEMARLLEIDAKTLRLHFRRELDTGMTEANVRVAQALYTNATKHNNTQAQIWWTKARMGWKGEAEATNVNVPVSIDFRWADALAEPPTIEHEPAPLDVAFASET
jgi:hypothetical protein